MTSSERRIFWGSEEKCFEIFNFKQNRKGDTYVKMPDFCSTNWLAIKENNRGKTETIIHEPLLENGKLSIHANGIAHYRPNSNQKDHRFQIRGQYLYNENAEKKLGARHLFSAFPQEPCFISSHSPYKNRTNDYLINTDLRPAFMIFYTIPFTTETTVVVGYDIDDEDLVNNTLDLTYGSFPLASHNILWICYRTKFLDFWPEASYLCYTDGIRLPFFVGIGPNKIRLELRVPKLTFKEREVSIIFPIPEGLRPE